MVVELDADALEVARQQLRNMADGLDDATDRRGKDSLYTVMGDAVDEQIINPVLRRARDLGRPHVGWRVSTIQPVTGEWSGDSYVAGLRTENEAVLAHNFGSGQYSATGPYEITPTRAKHLAFRVDGRFIMTKLVVHPGVRGKRFMNQAIREHVDDITESALDEAQQTLDDALDPKR